MKNKDLIRAEIKEKINAAITNKDAEAYAQAMTELAEAIREDVMEEANGAIDAMQSNIDSNILSSRGVRQLTSDETKYYESVIEAMKSPAPQQALANIDKGMPMTIIDSVVEDIKQGHELLSVIDFVPTTGLTNFLVNMTGQEMAKWGALSTAIVEELAGGIRSVDVTQLKLTAFLPVAKDMLDLGPAWLDKYVRDILAEASATAIETAIIDGTGKEEPIGMMRSVAEDVEVKGGVYPEKEAIKVTAFDAEQVGRLAAMVAVNETGRARVPQNLILVVNAIEYYSRVLAATSILTPNGEYRSTFPIDCRVIPSVGVPVGKAVFGDAKNYFMGVGAGKNSKIEYSDDARFLEDERVYITKLYANGLPKDNTSFVVLDITDLQPAVYKVENITPETVADDATLKGLKLGGVKITEAFKPATKTYTATTTNAKNTITATPAKASAEVVITANDVVVENGTAVTWKSGSNNVKVDVVDGAAKDSYTLTVTKN